MSSILLLVSSCAQRQRLFAETQFQLINDFGYVALNFGWVYKQDSGEYMVRATNKCGSAELSANLVCSGPSGINYDTQLPKEMKSLEQIHEMEMKVVQAYLPDREDDTERSKPCFMTKPEAVVCVEGTTARFCCRVTGYPKPRVMWLINGQTIINVRHHHHHHPQRSLSDHHDHCAYPRAAGGS